MNTETETVASFKSSTANSWTALLVCWMIWIIIAYDREVILRLGPTISKEFSLSPTEWGRLVSVIMFSLAVLDIPGCIWSDRYGAGWRRARFQVPLVLGYTAISFATGFKAISGRLSSFVAMRVGVNLGAGWGEPVGISNTAEWWPAEQRGFALGVHHTGYPVGAMLSGVVASFVIVTFGEQNWRYSFYFALVVALPLMLSWSRYSTASRISTLYAYMAAKGTTPPRSSAEGTAQSQGQTYNAFLGNIKSRNIVLTSCTTLLAQIVYMGVNIVLPAYLYNIVGLSLAKSASLSVVFTITGILGQLIWPTLSDIIGRKTTLIICGLWMAGSVGAFYLANTITHIVVVQLLFGLVANAVWPIYYAVASDSAMPGSTSTANSIITTAMFVGGGIALALMGWLSAGGGGWNHASGYQVCFSVMATCAVTGVLLQLATKSSGHSSSL